MWRWSENLETQSIQDSSRAILVVNTAAYYHLVQTRVIFHINYRSSPNFVCLCVFLMVWIDRHGSKRSYVQGDCILLGYLGCIQKALISQSWKVTSFSSWMFLSGIKQKQQSDILSLNKTKQYMNIPKLIISGICHFHKRSIFLIDGREGIMNEQYFSTSCYKIFTILTKDQQLVIIQDCLTYLTSQGMIRQVTKSSPIQEVNSSLKIKRIITQNI
ncbi:Hypothetical_protein [Hexamita inflata]|uniref:Hypothetical_protein n=1 Tax=Hexamita inflata TaxID=28002 RepID=A0AA86NK21_9EUKA|nr:Hypothetical protein HINF_LOCUS8227 [Hexamita inflata]